MLFIPSEDPNVSLALRGELTIALGYECIAAVKDSLLKNLEQALAQPQGDFGASSNMLADSSPVYRLSVDIGRMCPFMCSTNELDGRSLDYISRRKIVEPVSMAFSTREFMQLDRRTREFRTFSETTFKGEKVFVSISYQDVMYLSRAFVYNMRMLDKEYFARLIHFNELKGRGRTASEMPEGEPFATKRVTVPLAANRSSAFLSSSRLASVSVERPRAEYLPLHPEEENIWQVVAKAMSAVDQLRKASEAVAKYKQKAATYARKSKQPVSQKKQSTDAAGGMGAGRNKGRPKELKRMGTARVGMRHDGSAEKEVSGSHGEIAVVYGKAPNIKAIEFESVKIVSASLYDSTR